MDNKLHDKLSKWHDQITAVNQAEEKFLLLEASEKSLYSRLFLEAVGKNVAEKEALAYTHNDWLVHANGFALAKAASNHEKRLLELRQAAFNAEYLDCKTSNEAIQRFPRGIT